MDIELTLGGNGLDDFVEQEVSLVLDILSHFDIVGKQGQILLQRHPRIHFDLYTVP